MAVLQLTTGELMWVNESAWKVKADLGNDIGWPQFTLVPSNLARYVNPSHVVWVGSDVEKGV